MSTAHAPVPAVAAPGGDIGPPSRHASARGNLDAKRIALAVALLAGALLWVQAMTATDVARIAGLGLLDALPATYYVALALAILVTVIAALRADVRLAVAGLAVVILILHATTAVLYEFPRYGWSYKHFGVVAYFQSGGRPLPDLDIYQYWPSFFSLNAVLGGATGVTALQYAGWSEVFFNVAGVGATVYLARSYGMRPPAALLAGLIFELGNWVGQDYFAPQSLAFPLAVVVLGIAVRISGGARPLRRFRPRWLPLTTAERRIGPSLVGTRALRAYAALALLSVAIVLIHQLSPVIMLMQLIVLVALRRHLSVWLLVVVIAAEVLWVIHGYAFVGEHFKIFAVESGGTRPPTAAADNPDLALDHFRITAYAARLLTGAMLLAGVLSLLVGRTFSLVARVEIGACFAAPLCLALVQPYGGEAAFRGYLFALPWVSMLVAGALASRLAWTSGRGHQVVAGATPLSPLEQSLRSGLRGVLSWPGRRVGLSSLALLRRLRRGVSLLLPMAVPLVLAALFLPAYFGQEKVNYMQASDLQTERWLEAHLTPQDTVFALTPNSPGHMTSNYPRLGGNSVPLPSLVTFDQLLYKPLSEDIDDLAKLLATWREGGYAYFSMSPSQIGAAEFHGWFVPGSERPFIRALERDPRFRVMFRDGDAIIVRLRQRPAP